MKKRIKLKILATRIGLVADALLQYADVCTIMLNTKDLNRVEDFKIRLSIAMELYNKLFIDNHKVSVHPNPPAKYSISLELHQALVVQCALLGFINTNSNDFKRNAIETIKNNLNETITNLSQTVTT